MKKLLKFSPYVIGAIVVLLIVLIFTGAFDKPKEVTVTTSTLTEVISTAKLTTARYIQHGIAKGHIEGKKDGYIMYYAIVKANVNFEDIKNEINEETKTVTVTIPQPFFEVELLPDEDTHKWYYYPYNKKDWTGKDAIMICEADAIKKANLNTDLNEKAHNSLVDTLKTLLEPLLSKNGYQLVFISADNGEVINNGNIT